MQPYFQDGGVSIFHGDCIALMRQMPDESVHCCVTSPPYFGLRDYGTGKWSGGLPDCDHTCKHGVQGATGQRATRTFTAQTVYKDECRKCGAVRIDEQIGLERTWPEYVAKLVEVFREVRRVLRADGTCWMNLGDSYATGAGAVGECPGGGEQGERWKDGYRGTRGDSPKHAARAVGPMTQANRLSQPGLKPKDLMMIPARVAIALQDDGWYLRSDIIWAKPAPMPESVEDRPTRSHEYIFLLSKNERYYCDMEAIKEPVVSDHGSGNGYKRDSRLTYAGRGSEERWVPPPGAKGNAKTFRGGGAYTKGQSFDNSAEVERDSHGNAPNLTGLRNKRDVWFINSQPFPEAHFATFPPALILPCILAGCPVNGTVLDPFMGAATVALVAKENGRNAVGCELNAEYIDMAARRLSQGVLPLEASV